MLPPIIIPVPAKTKVVYLTAISLYKDESEVSVNWHTGFVEQGSDVQFGTKFVGPSSTHVLGDEVFKLPVITISDIPKELLVSMNFKDTISHQHSITGPVTTKVGPAGDAEQVQISGYAFGDHKHERPTTITILFQEPMAGVLPPLN